MSNKYPLHLQLINAVIDNDAEIVNELLNAGANPNKSLDSAGITPLHYAAQNNSIQVIPLLIEAGADLHAVTTSDRLTPIEIALMHGHDRVVQILIAYSINNQNEQAH